MNIAARKPVHQQKRAWFRVALLVLFVAEVTAFNLLVGEAPFAKLGSMVGWVGLAGALVSLPVVMGAFRRIRFGIAFYSVFLFTFVSLFGPSFAAYQKAEALRSELMQVKPGMTRRQVEQTIGGYEAKDCPSVAETIFGKNAPSGLCADSYYSSTQYYAISQGPLAHSDYAVVTYDRGRVVFTFFHQE